MLLLVKMEHYCANDKIIFKISMTGISMLILEITYNMIYRILPFDVIFPLESCGKKDFFGREVGLRENVFKKKKESYFCIILSNLEFHTFFLSYSI